MRRLAPLVLAAALTGLGCGPRATRGRAPAVPTARKAAVSTMVRAVEKAKRADRRREAIALLRQALADDPSLWEARYDLGVLLAQEGELAQSASELQRALELAPNAEDIVVSLAEVLRRREQFGDAADHLARFVEAFPGAISARRLLVSCLRQSGQPREALEHSRLLLRQTPEDPAALAELALTHLALGEAEVAELLVKEALAQPTRTAVAETAAGLIALERGEDALAFVHFSKASELDAGDATAGLNMANVLLQAGVFDRAEQAFRVVLEARPESVDARLGLAAALRGLSNRDNERPLVEAERLLSGVLSERPRHWAAAHNLALLYAESLHQPDRAGPLFEVFLAEAPADHPAAGRVRQWIQEHPAAAEPPPSPAPSAR